MNTITIYFQLVNNKVIALHTEQINDLYSESLEADNFDGIIREFNNKGYELSDEQKVELSEIFNDDISSANEDDIPQSDGFYIKHWVSNRSYGELIDMYDLGEIKKPEMQREFVWNSAKSSRFIESIILGLPIPPLFLLEVEDNEYEIIDGFQRLTTLFNYIKGYPWSGRRDSGRNLPARLSTRNIKESIAGKKFEDLDPIYKRKIKRSTVPLMEFKQISPGDFTSKYLIFERINTGSDKLNSMQIRKSLAYGQFMKDLYNYADSNEVFLNIFSTTQVKKDIHVEALLRTLAISDAYYKNYNYSKRGIKNMLDEYCEIYRQNKIDVNRIDSIFRVISELWNIFGDNIFKRVNAEGNFEGVLNVAILESLVGVIIENGYTIDSEFIDKYKYIMQKIYEDDVLGNEKSPFSDNTGTYLAIEKRYKICESMFGE